MFFPPGAGARIFWGPRSGDRVHHEDPLAVGRRSNGLNYFQWRRNEYSAGGFPSFKNSESAITSYAPRFPVIDWC